MSTLKKLQEATAKTIKEHAEKAQSLREATEQFHKDHPEELAVNNKLALDYFLLDRIEIASLEVKLHTLHQETRKLILKQQKDK